MRKISLIAFFFSFTIAFGQEENPTLKHYIGLNTGLHLGEGYRPNYAIYYGQNWNENLNWNINLDYFSYQGEKLMDDQLIHETDSFRVYRDMKQFNKSVLLGGEIDYRLFRYIKIGAGISTGFIQDQISFHDNGKRYNNEDEIWYTEPGIIRQYYPDLFPERNVDTQASSGTDSFHGYIGNSYFFSIGLRFNTGVSIPVGKHWEFISTYNGFLNHNIFLSYKPYLEELNLDGIEHYGGINTFNTDTPSFTKWNHSITGGIRYKFSL